MRPSLSLIGAGLIAATMMFGSNASATWQYDPVYGGLTQYDTPQSQSPTVTIIRNGIGRHPTRLTNTQANVQYDFQDNVAGQRAMRTRTTNGGSSTVSHFVFGGLNPMAEFDEDSGEVHYTVGDMYVTVDTNTVQTQYAVTDRLQSTRALLDGNLSVSAQFGYDTLGKPTENDQECTNSDCSPAHRYPYRFQNHQYLAWDDSSGGYQPGVTDNKDRFYSHDQGLRFMNTDAAGASISPYTAYGDDPVNAIDLDGTITFEALQLLLSNLQRTAGLSSQLQLQWSNDLTHLLKGHVPGSWGELMAYLNSPLVNRIFVADIHTLAEYLILGSGIAREVAVKVALSENISSENDIFNAYEELRIAAREQRYPKDFLGNKKVKRYRIEADITINGETRNLKFSMDAIIPTMLSMDMWQDRAVKYSDFFQKRNMDFDEIVEVFMSRDAAYQKILLRYLMEDIRWKPLGGEDYKSYLSNIKEGIEEASQLEGKLLISTGQDHVFRARDPKGSLWKRGFSLISKFKATRLLEKNRNESLDMLTVFGGVGLTLRNESSSPPKKWIGVKTSEKVDPQRFHRVGSYEYKYDENFLVDVWEPIKE